MTTTTNPPTITVYQADPITGAYLYPTIAHILPLDPDGNYNIPYGAVNTEPPAAAAGQVAQYAGGEWALVADNRATTLYNTAAAQQYIIGESVEVSGSATSYNGLGAIPAWLTALVPPAPGSTWTNGAWVAPAPTGA